MNPWDAEMVVTEELAASLITDQFPSLAPVSVRVIGTGWDNVAFLVNDRYVFRLPQREVAVQLIRNEVAVLNGIRDRVTIIVRQVYLTRRTTLDQHVTKERIRKRLTRLTDELGIRHRQ